MGYLAEVGTDAVRCLKFLAHDWQSSLGVVSPLGIRPYNRSLQAHVR
jgi:hypothetical protein